MDLPTLEPGACAAVVQSDRHEDGAKRYSMQRVTAFGRRRCSRKATAQVGHLPCCATHARMAREGFIDEAGVVADKDSIRDARKYPEKFPGGLYHWAPKP